MTRRARPPALTPEEMVRVYPFHQRYPGLPELFHVACHVHPNLGFCGERAEADEVASKHLLTHKEG